MYASQMLTPNQIRFAGQPAEPLLAAAGTAEAPTYIELAPDRREAEHQVAEHVQDIVRRSLHYPRESSEWLVSPHTPVLEAMGEYGQTTCYGYAYLGSELLSLAGINHYVAYGNGHWFLLQTDPSDSGKSLYMRDMLKPEFNGDVTSALRRNTPERIVAGLATDPGRQQNVILDTRVIGERLGMTTDQMAFEYPAFWGKSGDSWGVRETIVGNTANRRRFKERFNWVLSIYTPETGRKVLEHYDGFVTAVNVGALAVALQHTAELDGIFPDNDSRSKHLKIRSFVGKLCVDETYRGQVEPVIEAYCTSSRTGDARVQALRASLYRQVSELTGSRAAANLAAAAYRVASQQTRLPGFKATYSSKSDRIAQLAAAEQ